MKPGADHDPRAKEWPSETDQCLRILQSGEPGEDGEIARSPLAYGGFQSVLPPSDHLSHGNAHAKLERCVRAAR